MVFGERFGMAVLVLLNLPVHGGGSCGVSSEVLFFKAMDPKARIDLYPALGTQLWVRAEHTRAQGRFSAATEHGTSISTGTCTSLWQIKQ